MSSRMSTWTPIRGPLGCSGTAYRSWAAWAHAVPLPAPAPTPSRPSVVLPCAMRTSGSKARIRGENDFAVDSGGARTVSRDRSEAPPPTRTPLLPNARARLARGRVAARQGPQPIAFVRPATRPEGLPPAADGPSPRSLGSVIGEHFRNRDEFSRLRLTRGLAVRTIETHEPAAGGRRYGGNCPHDSQE